jgi:hypothetical protein
MTIIISPDTVTMADGTSRKSFGRARIVDQKEANTPGGASVAGTQTRSLNTILFNDIGVLNPSDGRFTLQPGTYIIEARAPAYNVGNHKAYIAVDQSPYDPVAGLMGTAEYSYNSNNASQTSSIIRGRIAVAVATTFVVRHYTQTALGVNGLGVSSPAGVSWPEIYTTVDIEKEK